METAIKYIHTSNSIKSEVEESVLIIVQPGLIILEIHYGPEIKLPRTSKIDPHGFNTFEACTGILTIFSPSRDFRH